MTTNKRRSVISYANLSPELQIELKKAYPTGYTDHLVRIDKPNGEFFCAVPFETEEVSYLVKINVKIDEHPEEIFEKNYDDDNVKDEDIIEKSSDEEDD